MNDFASNTEPGNPVWKIYVPKEMVKYCVANPSRSQRISGKLLRHCVECDVYALREASEMSVRRQHLLRLIDLRRDDFVAEESLSQFPDYVNSDGACRRLEPLMFSFLMVGPCIWFGLCRRWYWVVAGT